MGIISWSENRLQTFKIWDFAIFKTYLFVLGAIIGAYFSDFVKDNIVIAGIIVGLTLIWLMIKMFKK